MPVGAPLQVSIEHGDLTLVVRAFQMLLSEGFRV